MTKISKKSAYPVKIPVRKDYFVGTDSENNGKTVNFDFESTAKLINELNGTPILNYLFRTDNNINLTVLTDGVFLSEGNETTLSSISKLYINKNNFSETSMADLFRFIATNREAFVMKLRNSSNLNNGVYFRITDATEYETHFTLDVTVAISNAAIPELINFNVYFFDFELNSVAIDFGSKLDKDGYTGTAKTLDNRLAVLENQTDTENIFVEMQSFSYEDNVLTIYLGWIWKLLGVTYSNVVNVMFPITFCAVGKTRLEYFVPNNTNGFTRIVGEETLGIAQAPQLPAHGLYVTYFLVTDSGIGTPQNPNTNKTPNIDEVLGVGYSTTKPIWFFNQENSNCLGITSERILFQKEESIFNEIRSDNTTESYNVQLPNKTGSDVETIAMLSDLTIFNEDFEADETQDIEVPTGIKIKSVNVNQLPALRAHWSQTGNIVTVTTSEVGNIITLIN